MVITSATVAVVAVAAAMVVEKYLLLLARGYAWCFFSAFWEEKNTHKHTHADNNIIH